jgi:hypothetical protein
MKNRERRKEVARVFFDVAKYLLTTIAVGSLFTEQVHVLSAIIAIVLSFGILFLAYFVTPRDKEE